MPMPGRGAADLFRVIFSTCAVFHLARSVTPIQRVYCVCGAQSSFLLRPAHRPMQAMTAHPKANVCQIFIVVPLWAFFAGYKLPHKKAGHYNADDIQPHAGHDYSPFSRITTNAAPATAIIAAPERACALTSGIIIAAANKAADVAWHNPEIYCKSSFFIRASITR